MDKYQQKIKSLVFGKDISGISEEIEQLAIHYPEKGRETIRKDFCAEWENTFSELVKELCVPGLSLLEEKIIRDPIMSWLKFVEPNESARLLAIEKRKRILGGQEREIKLLTFKELFYSPKNKRTYIVSELIPKQSLLMLIGYGKVGKTRFITSLCAAVAEGRPFLGRQTKKSKILFIQNESTLEEAANLMYYAGLQNIEKTNEDKFQEIIDSNNICFLNYVDINLDQEKIFEEIEKNQIDFVVIDSLTASVQLSGLTEQSKEIGSILYSLQHRVKTHNIACVLIHHCTKNSKDASTSQDLLMSMAGLNTIVRANDGVLALLPGKEPQTLNFQAVVRHIPELQLTLKTDSGMALYTDYKVTKSSTMKQETMDLATKIVEELQKLKKEWEEKNQDILHKVEDYYFGAIKLGISPIRGITPSQAIKKFSCTEYEFAEATNWMLLVNGIQHRIERGEHVFYFGEKEDSWLLSLVYKKEEEDFFKEKAKEEDEIIRKRREKEINAKALVLINASSKDEIVQITKDWAEGEVKTVVETFTDDQFQEFAKKMKPPKFDEGSFITYKNKEYVVIKATNMRDNNKRPWFYLLESTENDKKEITVSQEALEKGVKNEN
jgi:hypothetical protein